MPLLEFEQRHGMSSEEFFRRWLAGDLDDTADFLDWNALHRMAGEVRERLDLLRGETEAA